MKLLNVGNVGKIFYVALTEKVVHEVSFLIIENNEINLQTLHSKYSSRSNVILFNVFNVFNVNPSLGPMKGKKSSIKTKIA